MKKIYKFPTGAEVPEGAIYLNTVTQTKIEQLSIKNGQEYRYFKDCWLVWHYFLVEVKE